MEGFNPLVDAAVIGGFMVALLVMCFIGTRYEQYKKSKLRGATRV